MGYVYHSRVIFDSVHFYADVPQFEFVRQLSGLPKTVIFAIVRNEGTAKALRELGRANVHILEADITDHLALKVSMHYFVWFACVSSAHIL